MRRFLMVAAAALGLIGGRADAGLILDFTITVRASGSLDGNPFTDATVTFTGSGDTAGRFFTGANWVVPLSVAGVDVSGAGSDTFTDPFNFISNPNFILMGFTDTRYPGIGSATLVAINDSTQTPGYDLSAPIPPVTAPVIILSKRPFSTNSGGTLQITSLTDPTGGASAPAAVPEPTSMVMMGMGVVGLMGYTRWRRAGAITA